MSFEQEKMIVESLPSLYPLQKFEEEAINALVSLPIDDDAISRKAAIKEVSRDITVKGWKDAERVVEPMKIFADRIEQLPPAQSPMPSNTSNALKALNSVNSTQLNALDSISRQAAIKILHEALDAADQIADVPFGVYQKYRDKMNELPPALPEHIIHCKDCENHLYRDWCRMVQHATSDYSDCAKELYAKRKENDDE